MLAAFDPPPPPPSSSSPSWADIGRSAVLDALRGLTGGSAAAAAAGKVGAVLGDGDAAAAAAAARARAQADTKRTLLIVGGVAGVVLLGVLLLRK